MLDLQNGTFTSGSTVFDTPHKKSEQESKGTPLL